MRLYLVFTSFYFLSLLIMVYEKGNSETINDKLYSDYCTMKVSYSSHSAHITISVELVDECMQTLKLGKAASFDKLTSEHLLYCTLLVSN